MSKGNIWAFLLLCMVGWFLFVQRKFITHVNSIDENSIFIYRVYLDRRGGFSRLRLLAFNKCLNESVLQVQIGTSWMLLQPKPMREVCPEEWAPGCLLVAHFHEVFVEESFAMKEVVVKGPNGTQVLPVHIAEPAREFGITMCIAPMFWYTDWAKLIFFIEYWKKQQVKTINIYVHSTSVNVREVLNFYEKKGVITIIPWPMMPSSATFQPSGNIYRLGQIFSHNDCFLRTTTEFTTLVDIDEILYTSKQPLTDYVLSNFKNQNLGSLTFPHHQATFQSPVMPKPFDFQGVDYKGIRKVNYKFDKDHQPVKIIARTDAVESIAVHKVVSFRNGELDKKVNATDGMLLHFRYTIQLSKEGVKNTSIVADPLFFQLNLLDATRKIFPNGTSYNEETQIVLGTCTASWRETQNYCKAPVTFCRSWIIDKEEWVEETENVYTVL